MRTGGFRLSSYTSIQGDMWDLIAKKVYGDERYMSILLSANPSISEYSVLPAGLNIVCPSISAETVTIVPPWRK